MPGLAWLQSFPPPTSSSQIGQNKEAKINHFNRNVKQGFQNRLSDLQTAPLQSGQPIPSSQN